MRGIFSCMSRCSLAAVSYSPRVFQKSVDSRAVFVLDGHSSERRVQLILFSLFDVSVCGLEQRIGVAGVIQRLWKKSFGVVDIDILFLSEQRGRC